MKLSNKYNFIAIEGNIGAGKTTLASRLAEDFNGKLILEQFEENHFLPKFYENPSRYAFPLELSFLAERYNQLKNEFAAPDLFKSCIIADYFINKSLIFAKTNLQEDEYSLYSKVFQIMGSLLPKPDLLIYLYLDIHNLKKNILGRGRNYELKIPDDYLLKVQKSYLDHINQQKNMKVLLVDCNNLDFVKNGTDYARLAGLLEKDYNFGLTYLSFSDE